MKFVDWSAAPDKPTRKGAGQFLKIEIGKKYRIRLIGKPVRYHQHWEPIICRSPGIDESGKTLDPLMLQGLEPKMRYAMWVIDREDGSLKIMDFAPSLYNEFVEWKTNFNDDPGGKNGPDWNVKAEAGAGGKKRTQYKASHLDRAPLTDEEIKLISESNLKEKLTEYRRPHTAEEIRAMLSAKGFGPPSEASEQKPAPSAPKTAAPAAPAAQQPVAPKPRAADEDEFGF